MAVLNPFTSSPTGYPAPYFCGDISFGGPGATRGFRGRGGIETAASTLLLRCGFFVTRCAASLTIERSVDFLEIVRSSGLHAILQALPRRAGN